MLREGCAAQLCCVRRLKILRLKRLPLDSDRITLQKATNIKMSYPFITPGNNMLKSILCALILALAVVASAAAAVSCNQHGAVVTRDDGTVLYLGRNCEAARKGGGTGWWWYAASFIGVEIDGKTFAVREEIDCLPFCRLSDIPDLGDS